MFFKKKKKAIRVEVKSVPLPILIRQIIYDTMLEPAEEIAEYMGLPPISNEVADMEEQDSQKRLARFAELLPYIESHSDIVARIATGAYSIDGDDDDLSALNIDKESLEKVTSLFRIVAVTATISCISSLYNLELLQSKAEYHE